MKKHVDNTAIAGFHTAVIAGLTRNRACELDAVNPLKRRNTGIRRHPVWDASLGRKDMTRSTLRHPVWDASTERCNPDGLRAAHLSGAYSTERCNPNGLPYLRKSASNPRHLRAKTLNCK